MSSNEIANNKTSIKSYDLVVFGATSFVGQILTTYLVEHIGVNGDISWAVAARSESKLAELKNRLGAIASELPLLLADSHDKASLQKLCSQTRVILSTVGPYALYGEQLVACCAENGTDYADLTGEAHWIKQMQDKYQQATSCSP